MISPHVFGLVVYLELQHLGWTKLCKSPTAIPMKLLPSEKREWTTGLSFHSALLSPYCDVDLSSHTRPFYGGCWKPFLHILPSTRGQNLDLWHYRNWWATMTRFSCCIQAYICTMYIIFNLYTNLRGHRAKQWKSFNDPLDPDFLIPVESMNDMV